MSSHFENVAASIDARIKAEPGQKTARKRFVREIAELGMRLLSGQERVAWCGVLAPFDLLGSMGVTSCFVEFVGGWLASMGNVEPMLAEAEQAGFSTDGCSYHRAVIGAARQGIMPEPDFLIATSTPCTGGLAAIENLARHFDKDVFVLHIPSRDDEAGVRYLAEQFHAMADFVAAHTGEPPDPNRLRTAVERTNETRSLLLEVYELAKAVPTPARPRDLSNFGIVMPLLYGTEGAAEVARAYRDEFAEKVRTGRGGTAEERVRLLWLQNRIQFHSPLEQLLEEEMAAIIVCDELNRLGWDAIDPDDPFPGMARRALSVTLTGPAEKRLDVLRRQAREYKVDGAVNPCHWGCRQGTGARGLVEQGLREVDVPVLNLEVDCVDPRNFSEGQMRTRLSAFIETLTARASC